MKWQDIDTRFPDQVWPTGDDDRVQAAATHLARAALGLPTRSIDREAIVAAVRQADRWAAYIIAGGRGGRFPNKVDENPVRGLLGLIAAQLGAWDEVALVTGDSALGTRLSAKKTFGADTRAFARQLATAVRSKLPPQGVITAMTEQRERFIADEADPRAVVIAASLFAREMCAAIDPIEATRRWLDSGEIEVPVARTVTAVADGEDHRVKIFERYAPELEDDEIDRMIGNVQLVEEWGRWHHRERLPIDSLAIRAFVARRPLFENWAALVDPVVAVWLGADPTRAYEQRIKDGGLTSTSLDDDRHWDRPAKELAQGKPDDAMRFVKGTLPAFKPGQFFKDDGRKLLRYLANAMKSGASEADVEPAWFDFLARRSPKTTPLVETSALDWKNLLSVQAAITAQIGKRSPNQVGGALRKAITGSF
jgi:hypothetical protein